jgi:small GTP-binding protein
MKKSAALPGQAAARSSLPATLAEIRRLFDALDWTEMARQVEAEAQTGVAIVGPVNSGKSTLFNTLKGRDVSPVGAVPGTTQAMQYEEWGPFTLVDTPGFGEVQGVDRAQIALEAVRRAGVLVLVLDAVAGVRQADLELLQQLKATGKPVVIVLNKMDLVTKDDQQRVLSHASDRLGEPGIIPVSAKEGTNVARALLPQLVAAQPSLAVALGRALPAYRRLAANSVVRQGAVWNAVIGAEPVPGLDIPFLLAVQAQMVLRVAVIYGEPMSVQRARTLAATIVGGVALRYLAQQGAKFIPGPGWIVAGSVAAAGTWAIGQVAIRYFEYGERLSPAEMQEMYRSLLRNPRRQKARKQRG